MPLNSAATKAIFIHSEAVTTTAKAIKAGMADTMYCKHCGNKVEDEAVVCVKCGCIVDETAFRQVQQKNIDNDYYSDNIMLWTKVLMIISCIASVLFAILSLYLFFYLAINGAMYDYLGITIDPTPYMFSTLIWSAIAALNICMT